MKQSLNKNRSASKHRIYTDINPDDYYCDSYCIYNNCGNEKHKKLLIYKN